MNELTGLIFADDYDIAIPGITDKRALAAVPFGARYRVIDFTLSNMMNAGVKNVGVVMTENYFSLVKHMAAGAPWDFNLKRSSLMVLPPFSTESVRSVYQNRLEAMQANHRYLRQVDEKYVVFTGSDYIGNIDFNAMLQFHKDSGARITALYSDDVRNIKEKGELTLYKVAEDGSMTDVIISDRMQDDAHFGPEVYIMETADLLHTLDRTFREGKNSFRIDVLKDAILAGDKVMAYRASEPILMIDDTVSYLKSSLELLDPDLRKALFRKENAPIITRVKDSAPTRYGKEAVVENSLVSDGVTIEGEVRNCIIFRGVTIKKGAIVENSVIMQDSSVGEMARLNYCVMDKNSIINDGRMLSGYITHPFYVEDHTVI